MKKLFYMISAVALMASFGSCNKIEQGNAPVEGTTTITVSASVPQTKVYLNSGNTRWQKDDIVTLFGEKGNTARSKVLETSTTYNFTFAGWPVEDTPDYLVFNGPVSDNIPEDKIQDANYVCRPVFEEGKFIMTVREDQQITNDGSFSKYANLSVGKLAAGEYETYTTEMKNVCGLIKFSFVNNDAIKVQNVLIRNLGDAPLAGVVKVDYNNGVPVAEVVEGKGVKEVLIKAKSVEGSEIPYFLHNAYYACVLPGTYAPELVLNYNIEGVEPIILKGPSEVTVERNKIMDFGEIDKNIVAPEQPGTGDEQEKESIVITVDFASQPFTTDIHNHTSSAQQDKTLQEFTLEQNDASYQFVIYSPEVGFCRISGCLRLVCGAAAQTKPGYIKLPAIDGYKLDDVVITGGNSADNTGGKKYTLYKEDPTENTSAKSCGLVSINGKVDGTLYVNSPEVGVGYYLSATGKNTQFSKLVLTYTK